jgi:hypothetical protein
MKGKLTLFGLAVLGSVMSFIVIDNWIVPMSIGHYILIEVIITAAHELYNQTKKHVLNS